MLIVGVADEVVVPTLRVILLLVRVSVDVLPTMVSVAEGKVKVVPSVPASVRVLLIFTVLLFAISNEADVAGPITIPLIEVAVATPSEGVIRVGEVMVGVEARTKLPVPVVDTKLGADVPFPSITVPDVMVESPVPPFATGNTPVTSVVRVISFTRFALVI